MAQKQIGPNFSNELATAGLLGLPFAWDVDGNFTFGPAMTDLEKGQVATVYAAHDPAKPDPNATAAALMAGGLTIASAGTPALDGVYGCSLQDQINVTALQSAVAAGVFPGFLRDRAGARHDMTGAQFTAIATAIMGFIVAISNARAAALAGGAWVAPPVIANIP